jgi:hypothetical protein
MIFHIGRCEGKYCVNPVISFMDFSRMNVDEEKV